MSPVIHAVVLSSQNGAFGLNETFQSSEHNYVFTFFLSAQVEFTVIRFTAVSANYFPFRFASALTMNRTHHGLRATLTHTRGRGKMLSYWMTFILAFMSSLLHLVLS